MRNEGNMHPYSDVITAQKPRQSLKNFHKMGTALFTPAREESQPIHPFPIETCEALIETFRYVYTGNEERVGKCE